MKAIRNRSYRIIITLAVTLIFATFVTRTPPSTGRTIKESSDYRYSNTHLHNFDINQQKDIPGSSPLYAWWGTLYPRFCYAQKKSDNVRYTFWIYEAIRGLHKQKISDNIFK